jgi:hypothetical protein
MLSSVDMNMLIAVGAFFQTLAMLFRNQIVLRTMFIVGSSFYVTYYIHVLPTPLWEAATASIAMAATTAIGLISLLVGRSKAIIPKHLLDLYEHMGNIQPGEFRALMRCGARRTLDRQETLTVQGQTPTKLYYIEAGQIETVKNEHSFPLPTGIFIGEIAFMTGAPASATVHVAPGSRIVEWDSARLRRKARRKDKLRLALDARLAQDLANKVANAVGSNHSRSTNDEG